MSALALAEAAELGHNDLYRWIADACSDAAGECCWCYLQDFFGDSESGNAIVSVDGDLKSIPYTISDINGKPTCALEMESAVDVLPRTVYEPEADEADHYTSMESAGLYVADGARLVERTVSKAERDAADSASFAGKGKSFPILKPGDVMAAVRSIGRAGAENYNAATLKKNIARIAKAKGWGKYLPKSWQTEPKESAKAGDTVGDLRLVESAVEMVDTIRLNEARSDYEIKLIAPGKGSCGYYTKEVLQRDGPKIFTAGTHMYWNHATDMEESQRPEGDLNNLAGVLTSVARYLEDGKQGPGLYARAKVFSDFAERVAEKAPHTGLSIRAAGVAEKGKMVEGRPVVAQLTYADSVDFVTKAGAGGMMLTESAKPAAGKEGADMDSAELTSLRESNRRMAKQVAGIFAREQASAYMEGVSLPAKAKAAIIARCIESAPVTTEGELDGEALKSMLARESKHAADLLGDAVVIGMGGGAPVQTDPAKVKESFDETLGELADVLGIKTKEARSSFVRGKAAA